MKELILKFKKITHKLNQLLGCDTYDVKEFLGEE